MARAQDPGNLTSVMDRLIEGTGAEHLSFGQILKIFGRRAYGPSLLVPGLLALGPTGAIPGMSILTGAIIGLISLQLVARRSSPWLPARLMRATISRSRLQSAIAKARPVTERIDSWIKPRLLFLSEAPFDRVIALLCLLMALLMFPFAALPFAVAMPAASICLLALGLMSEDGLLILIGAGLASIVVAGTLALVLGVFG